MLTASGILWRTGHYAARAFLYVHGASLSEEEVERLR